MALKLGSLFDGSGGFPLAGVINGIEPVWASEIEPYPMRVTTARFPDMKHLGDVTKIDGGAVEPVDIITFGSPCQDLSVAGKQAGLHKGERSNLFFEAIRIIKEMREATNGMHPRIAVWENVPGAYSSNKGEDFRAVLQAFCSVKDETTDVPRPAAGKWNRAGAIVGNGWSVAWRTFDAQYWGVPQRRKRIYLIADFGSERAGEILFEQESVRGDSAESGTAGEGIAGDAEGSVGRSGFGGIFFKERAGCPGGGKGILCGDKPFTLSTLTDQAVCYPINTMVATRWKADDGRTTFGVGDNGDPQFTIGAAHEHAVCYAAAFKYGNSAEARGIGYQEEISPTLQAGEGGNQKPVVCYAVRTRNTTANGWGVAENAYTLDTSEGQAVAYSVDCRNMNLTKEHGTLQAKENGGYSLNYIGAVCYSLDRASFNQGINAKYDICIEPELNSPLVARGPSAVCYALDQQGGKGGANYAKGVMPSLCSDSHGTPHGVCYPIDLIRESRGAFEAYEQDADKAGSLKQCDNKGSQVVCYPIDSHQQDSRFKICEDGVCPTVPGQMGTGGNNGPMVMTYRKTAHPRTSDEGQGWEETDKADTLNVFDNSETRTPTAVVFSAGNGQLHQALEPELARPLDCMHDQQIVLHPSKPPRRYIIRRLTPLECCRLQGFPDYWCSDLGIENPTEDDIAFWTEVWETHRKINGVSKKPKSRKQIIKWLQNPHSDSAEYKMWGNGIALPNAEFVVRQAKKLLTSK